MGWPLGTVAGRLARARSLLAKRLTRRGVALSAAALHVALGPGSAAASVPAPLILDTVKAASLTAAGKMTGGILPAQVVALTQGVLRAMFLSKLKVGIAFVLVALLLGSLATMIRLPAASP